MDDNDTPKDPNAGIDKPYVVISKTFGISVRMFCQTSGYNVPFDIGEVRGQIRYPTTKENQSKCAVDIRYMQPE